METIDAMYWNIIKVKYNPKTKQKKIMIDEQTKKLYNLNERWFYLHEGNISLGLVRMSRQGTKYIHDKSWRGMGINMECSLIYEYSWHDGACYEDEMSSYGFENIKKSIFLGYDMLEYEYCIYKSLRKFLLPEVICVIIGLRLILREKKINLIMPNVWQGIELAYKEENVLMNHCFDKFVRTNPTDNIIKESLGPFFGMCHCGIDDKSIEHNLGKHQERIIVDKILFHKL